MATHSAPSDNAVRRAARAAAQKRNARRLRKGDSSISDIAAKARKVGSTRNGPKASETDHLRPDQFSGKHHAPVSYASVMKNARGGDTSTGRHSKEAASKPVYQGRHAGSYAAQHASDHFNQVRDIIGHGGRPMGKHAKVA